MDLTQEVNELSPPDISQIGDEGKVPNSDGNVIVIVLLGGISLKGVKLIK